MTLHELLGWPGPMSHRQFRTWGAWLAQQWDEPDRTDAYLMQVACEVHKVPTALFGKRPSQAQPRDFRLRFDHAPPSPQGDRGLTAEEMAEASKSVWIVGLGGPGRIRGLPAPDA